MAQKILLSTINIFMIHNVDYDKIIKKFNYYLFKKVEQLKIANKDFLDC